MDDSSSLLWLVVCGKSKLNDVMICDVMICDQLFDIVM